MPAENKNLAALKRPLLARSPIVVKHSNQKIRKLPPRKSNMCKIKQYK
jgi:hypothetical protein